MNRFKFYTARLALVVALFALPGLAQAGTAKAMAPFGDKVSAAITNYNRASPMIGTAGLLLEGGVMEAKRLGFKTILNLLTAKEGAEIEREKAKAVGIKYLNIPVPTRAPTDAQVREFARIINDPANLPILVHCETANRVGAMWALYRASKGVPAMIAVEEGRAIGLKPSREKTVRKRLGLPPLS